jgi:MoaA/NifB/PqqE/SkfB family radical SAM enzyme
MHSAERGERLSTGILFAVIDELAALGCQSVLFVGGGEPMTHPATVEAIERAADHGMAVGLVTNGSRVFPEDAERLKRAATYLRFSLDAADPQLHLRLHRNNDHDRIITNLTALAAAEGRATVGTGFFINEVNVGDIVACGELVKRCGADYIQYKSYSGMPIAASLHERMLRQLAEAIDLDDSSFDVHIVGRIFDNALHQVRGYSRCHWQAFKPVIGADGSVYLCAQKRTSSDGIIGNVNELSFADIWTGQQRRHVLEALDLVRCPFCVHDRQNKMIEFFGGFQSPHGSFF